MIVDMVGQDNSKSLLPVPIKLVDLKNKENENGVCSSFYYDLLYEKENNICRQRFYFQRVDFERPIWEVMTILGEGNMVLGDDIVRIQYQVPTMSMELVNVCTIGLLNYTELMSERMNYYQTLNYTIFDVVKETDKNGSR